MYESSDFIIVISEITLINAIKTYKLRGKRYAVFPPDYEKSIALITKRLEIN
jgi:hypothetical protein